MTSLPAVVRVCVFVLLATLLGDHAGPLAAQIVVEEIDSHKDTSGWAFHAGRIFAAVKSTNSVIEYDTSGVEVRLFKVQSEPTEMIIKGDRLIVACSNPSSFSVIDLKTRSLARF